MTTAPVRSSSVTFWAAWTGNPCERLARLLHRLARLEQVADDQRDAEAVSDLAPAAEGQRGREAGVVHAVEQAPEAVAHADHAPAGPGRRADDALRAGRRIVVVAHEDRIRVAAPRSLRAAHHKAGRPVEREKAGRQLVAAGELDEALVGGDQLGHVPAQHPAAGREIRASRLALLQVPAAVGRPHRVEGGLPLVPGLELLDRLERQPVAVGSRGRLGRVAPVVWQQLELVLDLVPDGLPVAVDRLVGDRRQAERLDPLGQFGQRRHGRYGSAGQPAASPHQSPMNRPSTCAVSTIELSRTRSSTPWTPSAWGPKQSAGVFP